MQLTVESDDNRRGFTMQTFIEVVDKKEVYLVGRAEGKDVEITNKDAINVCLLLGPSFIDNQGRETTVPDWIRCTRDNRERERQISKSRQIKVAKEGVVFSLSYVASETYALHSVSYRIELLPRKPPSVKIPPHIYSELIKTKKGMNIFKESGHIPSLLEDIQTPELSVLSKRAAIWGLGHAGSIDRGAVLL